MKRTLSLRRESLAALTPEELGSVAAGAAHTLPDPECVTALPSIRSHCELPDLTALPSIRSACELPDLTQKCVL